MKWICAFCRNYAHAMCLRTDCECTEGHDMRLNYVAEDDEQAWLDEKKPEMEWNFCGACRVEAHDRCYASRYKPKWYSTDVRAAWMNGCQCWREGHGKDGKLKLVVTNKHWDEV